MKTMLGIGAVVLALMAAVPSDAVAQHRDHRGGESFRHNVHQWRGGNWHHGSHSGRIGWWWIVDGMYYPYARPLYPYPEYVGTQTIVVEQAPQVVVQNPQPVYAPNVPQFPPMMPPAPSQTAAQMWHYCDATQMYYPYVTTCSTGWRAVPATPPGVSR